MDLATLLSTITKFDLSLVHTIIQYRGLFLIRQRSIWSFTGDWSRAQELCRRHVPVRLLRDSALSLCFALVFHEQNLAQLTICHYEGCAHGIRNITISLQTESKRHEVFEPESLVLWQSSHLLFHLYNAKTRAGSVMHVDLYTREQKRVLSATSPLCFQVLDDRVWILDRESTSSATGKVLAWSVYLYQDACWTRESSGSVRMPESRGLVIGHRIFVTENQELHLWYPDGRIFVLTRGVEPVSLCYWEEWWIKKEWRVGRFLDFCLGHTLLLVMSQTKVLQLLDSQGQMRRGHCDRIRIEPHMICSPLLDSLLYIDPVPPSSPSSSSSSSSLSRSTWPGPRRRRSKQRSSRVFVRYLARRAPGRRPTHSKHPPSPCSEQITPRRLVVSSSHPPSPRHHRHHRPGEKYKWVRSQSVGGTPESKPLQPVPSLLLLSDQFDLGPGLSQDLEPNHASSLSMELTAKLQQLSIQD